MSDLRMVIGEGGADLSLVDEDLELDLGLETAVLVSLHSDARRDPGDPQELDDDDPRGWWGDAETPDDRFGSKLWFLEKETTSALNLSRMRDYVQQAVAWMLDAGIIEKAEVTTDRPRHDVGRYQLLLYRGSARRWQHLWDAIEAQTFQAPGLTVHLLTA